MQKKYLKFIVLLFATCFLFSISINFCWAAILPTPTGDCPSGSSCNKQEGICNDSNKTPCDYTLDDMVRTLPIIAKWILGIVGSLALLVFIYGGVVFLISAGSSEKIAQAKQIIIGAVIGLVIVFVSYMIISFVMTAFDVPGKENWATIGGIWEK